MEAALEAIGGEWAQRDRKRRRESAAAQAEAASSTITEETVETEETVDLDPLVGKTVIQQRLQEAVRCLIREKNDRRLTAGATFVMRSTYAMFVTVQALHPLPLGPKWAALLYACYFCVCNEFSDADTPPLQYGNGLSLRDLRVIVRKLGMEPTTGDDDALLMKASRKWEREADDELDEELTAVWRVLCDEARVRRAVEALLCPVQRAYLLFESR